MMLYGTVQAEGAMQKAAGGLLDKAEQLATKGTDLMRNNSEKVLPAIAGLGGAIGAATNDGNRAAGAIGGGIGGAISPFISREIATKLLDVPFLAKIPNLSGLATMALTTAAGGYGGGKLGAFLDRKTGNHLTQWTNKLLGRD